MRHLALLPLFACGPAELVVGKATDSGLVVPSTEATTTTTTTGTIDPYDQDGDGFTLLDGDCNDQDATVNPDADIVLGDDIDNACTGNLYGQLQVWLEVAGGDALSTTSDADGWVSTLLMDGDGEMLCYRTWWVGGVVESGRGVIADCEHCSSRLDLDFTTALEYPMYDPDYCGADVVDPGSLMLAAGQYWFDEMGFVFVDDARDNGILVAGLDVDTWESYVGSGWTTTHIGALPATQLTNTPMLPDDGWEIGSYAVVEEGTGANLGQVMQGGYYVGALYWSWIE